MPILSESMRAMRKALCKGLQDLIGDFHLQPEDCGRPYPCSIPDREEGEKADDKNS